MHEADQADVYPTRYRKSLGKICNTSQRNSTRGRGNGSDGPFPSPSAAKCQSLVFPTGFPKAIEMKSLHFDGNSEGDAAPVQLSSLPGIRPRGGHPSGGRGRPLRRR